MGLIEILLVAGYSDVYMKLRVVVYYEIVLFGFVWDFIMNVGLWERSSD